MNQHEPTCTNICERPRAWSGRSRADVNVRGGSVSHPQFSLPGVEVVYVPGSVTPASLVLPHLE
eukprot:1188394-Prorocentrum_minimum.AAC.4